MDSDSKMMARRAIETLRSGVPNRDAVRRLPLFQGDITQKFTELLRNVQQSAAGEEERPCSMVLSGPFGSGKSHLLEYLRHEALEHGCVCSHVVISKETPLFDSLKLLRTAAETASAPGLAGRALPEILFTQRFGAPQFAELFRWVTEQPGLGDRIAPLLKIVDEHPAGGEDFLDKIAWEWSGYPMKVSDIRSALREIDQYGAYQVKTIAQKELGNYLWRFLPRLFQSAGYNGWVVLVDEVELMLRYSKLQRAKSYAQIARLAGAAKGYKSRGILPVFAFIDEFWAIAEENLKDSSEMPEWLRQRGKPGDVEMARETEAGMKLLRHPRKLRPACADELGVLRERVRKLHSEAFGWDAPQAVERENLSSRSLREHVKSWIAEFDMMLLYPDYRPHILVEGVVHDYSEDHDLSHEEAAPDVASEHEN